MKILFIALLLATAGCTAPKPGTVTVTPRPPVIRSEDLVERVRFPEMVAVYHVARHADPEHPLLMHEAHAVYRVEGKAAWDLRSPPGLFALPVNYGTLTNVAYQTPHISDAVIAELNQQRMMTRTVTEQAESLNGLLQDFATALSNTRFLSEQNKRLHEQLMQTEIRLDELETVQRNQLQSPAWNGEESPTNKNLPSDAPPSVDGPALIPTAERDQIP